MTRSVLIFLAACFGVGVYAGTAEAAVYYNGYRVKVVQVGAISASPCHRARGCMQAVVELRYHRRHRIHLVRCPHPRNLHVMGTFSENGVRRVAVWACRRAYDWRLP